MRHIIAAIALSASAVAQEVKTSQWNGFERIDFRVDHREALIVRPKTPATGNPWIWRTEFFGHEPQGDLALVHAKVDALKAVPVRSFHFLGEGGGGERDGSEDVTHGYFFFLTGVSLEVAGFFVVVGFFADSASVVRL